MALTVEDGTGLAAAESYVSVADADTYHTAYGDPSAWSGATTAAKETALREGARFLDVMFQSKWVGQRSNEGQGLAWPRLDVTNYDGYELASTAIPVKLKDANAIIALAAVDGTDIYPDIAADDGPKHRSRVVVGPIEVEDYFDTSTTSATVQYRLVLDMIKEYISSGRIYRG